MPLTDAGAALAVIGPCSLADTVPAFGVADLEDLNAFVGAFLDVDASADFVVPFGVVDLEDLDAFVRAFLDGCP
ncbi:MAG: GC-type dockerin domain-anchored protein [Planctomycetota bacterium]